MCLLLCVGVLKKEKKLHLFHSAFFFLSSRTNLLVIFGRCSNAEAKQLHQNRRRTKKTKNKKGFVWPENYNLPPAAVVGLLSLRLGKVKKTLHSKQEVQALDILAVLLCIVRASVTKL